MGDDTKITKVTTFRVHKNIVSWLDNASRYFRSKGELLELILTKAALEQASDNGLKKFLSGIMDRHQRQFGDTAVIGVRLPLDTSRLIEDCASKRGESVSEWCSFALLDWQKEYSKFKENIDLYLIEESLQGYAANFRAKVASLCEVYARKSGFSPVVTQK